MTYKLGQIDIEIIRELNDNFDRNVPVIFDDVLEELLNNEILAHFPGPKTSIHWEYTNIPGRYRLPFQEGRF